MADRWSLSLLRKIGEKTWKLKRERGESGVIDALYAQVTDETDQEAAVAVTLAARVTCDWASKAFPTIRCAEKLGESFMATRVPPGCTPELLAPWPTMLIELPPNTLVAHDLTPSNGWTDREYVHWVFVQNMPSADPNHLSDGRESTHANWLVWPVTAAAGVIPPIRIRSLSEMSEMADSIESKPGDMMSNLRPFDPDGRDAGVSLDANASTARMLLRFVLGCLIELSSVQSLTNQAKRVGPPRRRKTKEPTAWVFKLTRDVRFDCREWVRGASESGEKRMLTIQSLVRGHWKPRLSERLGRPVHVEPYWRGPEDAPIAVRAHTVDGD